jgi:hypothetical protein
MLNSPPASSSAMFSVSFTKDIAVITPQDRAFLNSQIKEFSRIFEDLKAKNCNKFILDFSNSTYISSEGLSLTAQYWKWSSSQVHGGMAIVAEDNGENEIRNLFEILGMSAMIGNALQASVEGAVEYLSSR